MHFLYAESIHVAAPNLQANLLSYGNVPACQLQNHLPTLSALLIYTDMSWDRSVERGGGSRRNPCTIFDLFVDERKRPLL